MKGHGLPGPSDVAGQFRTADRNWSFSSLGVAFGGPEAGGDIGIILSGWVADYPTGSDYLQPLSDSRFIPANGNYNVPQIRDQVIDDLFDAVVAESDPVRAAEHYRQINRRIMEGAIIFHSSLPRRSTIATRAWRTFTYMTPSASSTSRALGVSDRT